MDSDSGDAKGSQQKDKSRYKMVHDFDGVIC